MFKKIIYFFLITSILACNNQNVTFLSGKIIKPTNNQIQLLKDEKVIKRTNILFFRYLVLKYKSRI